MIKALIVDDEEPSRHKIRNLLLPHVDFIHTVAEAASGSQAIDLIHQHRPNLVFLDIHLMDMTGFDVLQAITVDSPYIIFTTAYDNYALRAFEVLSVEYLLKPIETDRFNAAITKLKSLLDRTKVLPVDATQLKNLYEESRRVKQDYGLAVKQGSFITLIDYQQISHLQAEDKYVAVNHINGKKYLSDHTLSHLESQLPDIFLRVHRSTIINIRHILQIHTDFKSRYIITLNDKAATRIQTSSSYKEEIKRGLGL